MVLNYNQLTSNQTKTDLMVDINKYTYLPRWIVIWLIVGNLVAAWDAFYVILRPHSAVEGSLEKYFPLHKLYVLHDARYADPNDAFVVAQAVIGLSEAILSFLAVVLQYLNVKQRPLASLLALVACTMTWAKTIMYVTIEYFDKFKYTGHNAPHHFILYFALPMGLWIVVPLICSCSIIARFVTAIQIVNNTKDSKLTVKKKK
jgi:hypothetical protein